MSRKALFWFRRRPAKIVLFSELRLAHVLGSHALTDLAQPAEIDHFRCCERPHKSVRADTCNDAASGNKIQFLAFHSPSTS
jgi:hypothetical protein